MRRGTPVVFETSGALNACPHLRDRPDGACSAACVPVTFMGRALGVLHATTPDGHPLVPEQVAQLTSLATQAGARIGTVRAFQKTQLQAATDGLTGLINRRTLETRVCDLAAQHTLFALVLADLDRFKELNDTHGHEAGDRALRLFSQVVHSVVRGEDIVARLGGEEFVIILPGLDEGQAVNVLGRLRSALGAAHTGDHPVFTASFGVTDSSHGSNLDEILRVADQGLYVSKQTGRDRITVGKPGWLRPTASCRTVVTLPRRTNDRYSLPSPRAAGLRCTMRSTSAIRGRPASRSAKRRRRRAAAGDRRTSRGRNSQLCTT